MVRQPIEGRLHAITYGHIADVVAAKIREMIASAFAPSDDPDRSLDARTDRLFGLARRNLNRHHARKHGIPSLEVKERSR